MNKVNDSISDVIEKERNRSNLVLLGVPGKASPSDILAADDAVLKCAKHIGLSPGDIISSHRHGMGQNGRPRLIKIKFSNGGARRDFLSKSHDGRVIAQDFSRVWARPDLTFKGREQDRVLRHELKDTRAKGETITIRAGK